MARTTIRRSQRLPPYCMYCGAPASVQKNRRFAATNWFAFLFNVGSPVFPVPDIISNPLGEAAREIGDNSVVIPVSLCSKHKNHWMWRSLAAVSIVLLWVVVSLAILVFKPEAMTATTSLIGLGLYSVASVVLLVVVTKLTIRVRRIRSPAVLLAGLSPRFVEMLAEPLKDGCVSRRRFRWVIAVVFCSESVEVARHAKRSRRLHFEAFA